MSTLPYDCRRSSSWVRSSCPASRDSSIGVWDVRSGTQLALLGGHLNAVSSVAFSPSGNWIISGSDDVTVRLWDARDGVQSVLFPAHLPSGHEPTQAGRLTGLMSAFLSVNSIRCVRCCALRAPIASADLPGRLVHAKLALQAMTDSTHSKKFMMH